MCLLLTNIGIVRHLMIEGVRGVRIFEDFNVDCLLLETRGIIVLINHFN